VSIIVPRFQVPNPLDLMFFAFDRAARRLGLPGAFIHFNLELGGQLDVEGLKRTLAAVHRVYPATGSRLEWSPVLGRPRWRLDVCPPDLDRVVQVHRLRPATEEELQRRIDGLLGTPVDLVNLPPLQFHVFRGLSGGDLLAVRWPHALMDARGGCVVMEEIERLYQTAPDPSALTSAGDELHDDFARLTAGNRAGQGLALLRKWVAPDPSREWRNAQLPVAPELGELGPLRSAVRRLSAGEVRRVHEVSRRLCPSVRFGAFLRACAIRALHHLMPRPQRPRTRYSVPYVIEGRERPCRRPVCRNMFNLERVGVPADLAPDRAGVARLLHDRTAEMLAGGPTAGYLATVVRLSRLPTAVVAGLVRRSLTTEPPSWQRGELAEPPSLPMGFLRAFTRDMPTFCGARLLRTYAFRPPLPRVGLAAQVAAEQGQLTICGFYFEARAAMMHRFLDEFTAALLETD